MAKPAARDGEKSMRSLLSGRLTLYIDTPPGWSYLEVTQTSTPEITTSSTLSESPFCAVAEVSFISRNALVDSYWEREMTSFVPVEW